MKTHVLAGFVAGGLLLGGLTALVLAAQIDCLDGDTACEATKWQSWILGAIPTTLGFVLLFGVPYSMNSDDDETQFPRER